MNQNARMFGVALLILTLILAVILGLMAGPTSPITWILVALLIAIPFIIKKLETSHYVVWKDEYSVGINSIDLQHKKLLGLINQLQTAVDHKTGEAFEHEALDALVDYTKTHFTYEEGLLVQNDYPDYGPHKAQHEEMIKEVEAVLAGYKKDPDTAMRNAANYLKDWLINHINGTDKKYSSYLIDKGVK
jgi:hemerythrin